VVIFTGALAKHLAKVITKVPFLWIVFGFSSKLNLNFLIIFILLFEQDDPKVHAVVDKLLDVLNTPSESVQRAVAACLSPLMQSKQVCKSSLIVIIQCI
jgi:hypothetical protein